jgi:hypothetical protein
MFLYLSVITLLVIVRRKKLKIAKIDLLLFFFFVFRIYDYGIIVSWGYEKNGWSYVGGKFFYFQYLTIYLLIQFIFFSTDVYQIVF